MGVRSILGSLVITAGLLGAAGFAAPAQPPAAEPARPEPPPAQATPAPAAPAPSQPDAPVGRKVLPSGVEIEDLKVGDGVECKPGWAVVMHYRGTFKADGTEFDSSFKRGEPLVIPLTRLIRGWQEGVPGMKVGGKRRLTIPYAMAYGEQGRPPTIPPKADLVFEVELVGVK